MERKTREILELIEIYLSKMSEQDLRIVLAMLRGMSSAASQK